MKNVKIFSILFIAFILIIFCAVRFILMPDKNANNKVVKENIEDKVSDNVFTSKFGPIGEPKLILDADEIANLTIEYNSKIPVEAIIKNQSGYEKYYEEIIESIETISKEAENFTFYHEEGYYISQVPIYHFNVQENKISNDVQIILFSKDFEKQAKIVFFLDKNNEILTNVQFPLANIKVLRDAPDEQYILLYNQDELFLDSSNKLYHWMRLTIEVKGDYYHSLDYETLGISYNKLTDPSNLVWIDLNKK